MTTYATCGHLLEDDGEFLHIADWTVDLSADVEFGGFVHAVSTGTYCSVCAAGLRIAGVVLETEAARQAWLEGV